MLYKVVYAVCILMLCGMVWLATAAVSYANAWSASGLSESMWIWFGGYIIMFIFLYLGIRFFPHLSQDQSRYFTVSKEVRNYILFILVMLNVSLVLGIVLVFFKPEIPVTETAEIIEIDELRTE